MPNETAEAAEGRGRPKSPFAKHDGELFLGKQPLDCYVLDTGERVITLGSAVRAIAGSENSDLESYIGVQALRPYIEHEQVMSGTVEFAIPGTQFLGKGMPAETFLDICRAYVDALADDALTTDRQRELAIKASMLLSACAKVGLIALIDEATGYQYQRRADALQLKLRAYLNDELRPWEKTFPDELWEEFGRLTNWTGPLHARPKYWGNLVMEMIYEALDPEVASALRESKPRPQHGQNYHQWMSDNLGLPELIKQINQVIGIAKTCQTMPELRRKVEEHYSDKPFQLALVKDEYWG